MPLSVLGGERVGYAARVDALCREASRRTRYPRRDALIMLQADFTDQPEHLPELIKRFEGGADIVVAERPADAPTVPQPVRPLRRVAPWLMRPFVSRSPACAIRSARSASIASRVIRDLIKERGDAPLVEGEGWAANVDLLLRAAAASRAASRRWRSRRATTSARARRASAPWSDAMALLRFARGARGRSVRAARA